jgi:signal transduction histidine kinase
MLLPILLFNLAVSLFLTTLLVSLLHTRKKNTYIKEISNFLLLSLIFNFLLIIIRVGSFVFESKETINSTFSSNLFIINAILFFGSRASLAVFFKNVSQKLNALETKKFIRIILSLLFLFFCFSFFISNLSYLVVFAIILHFLGCYWVFKEIYFLKKLNKSSFINWAFIVVFLETFVLFLALLFLIYSLFKPEYNQINLSYDAVPFYVLKGTLLTADLIIFVFIIAFLLEEIYELSNRTQSENTLIKNLLIQQTSLTEAIQKSNKFIVSGALSASIAHELSHPLASIQTNAEILKMQLSAKNLFSGDIEFTVTKILRDNQRAGSTLKALKNLFSNKQELIQLNLNEVIKLCLDLVSSVIKKESIYLNVHFDYSIPLITANAQELQQALLNLLNNSIQAIQKSNRIDGEITINSKVVGNFIVFSIADNAGGLPIEIVGTIFEPFRTTKKEGMGFGLWLSKFIIEKNLGNIELLNSPGIGAKFIIKFPIFGSPPL